MYKGQIIKSTGGLYQVKTPDGIFPSKPRGLFRKDGILPLVGDFVTLQVDENQHYTISDIDERENALIRPPVANIEIMVLVLSTTDPVPNYVIIDKFLATMESHNIKTIIGVTKTDIHSPEKIEEIYKKTGYEVFVVDNSTGVGSEAIKNRISGKLCVFAGNTGVGKSSLLNSIDPNLDLATGETSKKLGRGKHTTRHVEIFDVEGGAAIADTPGFSSMDIQATTDLLAEDLAGCFIDFTPYIKDCKFNDCRHLSETDCGVKKAVEEEKIHKSRYESYVMIYDELKDLKEWQRK